MFRELTRQNIKSNGVNSRIDCVDLPLRSDGANCAMPDIPAQCRTSSWTIKI
jgi:hypothetical protein